MDIYIYNEQIEPVGIVDRFNSLIWVRRYSTAGSFELQVPATKNNVALLKPYRYIYRQNVGEAMYICSIQEMDDKKAVVVSGYSLDGLYQKRRLPDNIDHGSLIMTLSRCSGFGCDIKYGSPDPLDCGIVPDPTVNYICEMNAEDYMRYVLTQKGHGFDVRINPAEKCLEAKIISGRDLTKSMVFSEDLDNLSNSLYEFSELGCVNCIYGRCRDPGEDVERPGGLPEYEIGTEKAGLQRNESIIVIDPVVKTAWRQVPDGKGGFVMQEYKYVDCGQTLSILQETCTAAASDFTENFSGDVLADKYRRAFDVGDIVAVKNDARNIYFYKRVEEVQEVFDSGGKSVRPTFGEPLKTIYDLI